MKKIILILLVFSISATGSFINAQKFTTSSKRAINKFNKAYNAYYNGEYNIVLELLEQAIKIDDKFVEAYLMQADVYNYLDETENEIGAYKSAIAINPNFFPMTWYNLGSAQLEIGKYNESKEYLGKFLSYRNEQTEYTKKAGFKLEQCDFALKMIANPVPYDPKNLGSNVNSEYADYLPSLTIDETTLIITVCTGERFLEIGGCQEDFFECRKNDNGEWTKARNMGKPVNTEGNEGAQTISADGMFLFFTACGRSDGYGSCDIYFSMKNGEQWSRPKNLGSAVNSPYWESQPSFSSDGRTLYYTSNRPDGLGKKDIWMTRLNDNGTWSKPLNLGDSINTKESEMSPFIHPDNQTLYFCSDGHLGMGQLDLFIARRNLQNQWGKPVNLGYPINTFGEESSLIINAKGDKAYFASERLKGFGELDLYEFELYEKIRPKEVTYVKGTVYDSKTKKRLEAKFELMEIVSSETIVQSYSNPQTGEFLLSLPVERNYALNVSKPGYLFYSDNFSLKDLDRGDLGLKPFLLNIPLQPIEIGKTVILKNIFFEFDKFNLQPESNAELMKLVDFLKQNPGIKIEIGGHTDNQGSEEYNRELSDERAKSVYRFLLEQSIDKERLQYKGYGLSKPVATNDNPEGRALNRRTEFMITGK